MIMKTLNLLGFDFGASSGRAMLGTFDGEKIEISEVHRFSNDPVELCGRFVWDVPRLFYEMKQALLKISRMNVKVDAIGIDTWGVDFGMLDKAGRLLGLPVHYRDARTTGMPEKVAEVVPTVELFGRTGIANNIFNTLYQLYAMKEEGDPILEMADSMLFMPDLLAYLLTGKKGTEYTIASTSQMLNPYTRDWDKELLEKLGIPTNMLGEVKLPGEVRGTLLPQIAKECGVDEIPVIAVGGHDTASAVAAVPAQSDDFAYISSGTWSLLGAEIKEPLCEEGVMKASYTNEGAVDGSIRLLARTWEGALAESISHDDGNTWSQAVLSDIVSADTRFFVARTPSGRLLLVKNDHPKLRTNMTILLSEDDGVTWKYRRCIDTRNDISYPDADFCGERIYLTYDRERTGAKEIYFLSFTEQDIMDETRQLTIRTVSKP